MSNVVVGRAFPGILQPSRFCRNTMRPQANLGRQLSRALNFGLVHPRRTFLEKGTDLWNLPTGAAGEADAWHFYVETGYAASGALDVVADLIFAPSDAPAADDPQAWLSLLNGALVIHESNHAHYTARKTADIGWGDLKYTQVRCRDVEPNTAFGGIIKTDNYARLVGACVYEEHLPYFDVDDPRASRDPRYFDGAPIWDSDEERIRANADALYRANANSILKWSTDWNVTGVATVTSTTYKNLLDPTETAVSANSFGVRSQLRYHNPRGSTKVPCKLAVYGVCATAAVGKVAWRDASGTLLDVTLPTSAGWVTATGNVDKGASNTFKGDMMAKGDDGGVARQVDVYAFDLYPQGP